ncbi:MAG: hypothetical protein EFKGCFLK_01345 [Rhodocyclaceae bacterium]|nr:OmpA family protein [Zoogloeaceae bacterium]MBV6407777.1 hypothetical protein [Rhodocyclaceae bacterium]MCK6385604.1 OmpA family protein [Rhodocyclaceae bacterium]CAG0941375.1 putative lipoprotein YiaD [Gammaproteobacteria bacterium]
MLRKLIVAIGISLAALGVAAQTANPRCNPDPVFERYSRGVLSNCEKSSFKQLRLVTGRNPDTGESAVVGKEGQYWASYYSIAKNKTGELPSTLELQRNYENAVTQGGGKVLWKDTHPASMGNLTFQLGKGGNEYWGSVYCDDGNAQGCGRVVVEVVALKAMVQDVVLSAEQIAKDMSAAGKVAVYGIYFDTDKATIKPESQPTMIEMAKWMGSNGSAKVYIVGHTDMQGAADHNLKLSKARAAAVVEALIKQQGIKPDRLGSEGVGPYAPVASNASEAGRAKNRRVEMVLR